jgi:hypothetical protein
MIDLVPALLLLAATPTPAPPTIPVADIWAVVAVLLPSLLALFAAITSWINRVNIITNTGKVEALHLIVNSRLTQLLIATAAESRSAGADGERSKQESLAAELASRVAALVAAQISAQAATAAATSAAALAAAHAATQAATLAASQLAAQAAAGSVSAVAAALATPVPHTPDPDVAPIDVRVVAPFPPEESAH